MARIFNLQEGFTVEDDDIPQRIKEPLKSGAAAGSRVDPDRLKKAVHDYYGIMGWDEETGVPYRGKLISLGLEWLAAEESAVETLRR